MEYGKDTKHMKPTTRQRTSQIHTHTHSENIHQFEFQKIKFVRFFFLFYFGSILFSDETKFVWHTIQKRCVCICACVCLLFIWYHSQNQWQRNTKLIDTHTHNVRARERKSGREWMSITYYQFLSRVNTDGCVIFLGAAATVGIINYIFFSRPH